MCGIAGLFQPTAMHARERLAATVEKMTTALTHRGPDSSGAWMDERTGVVLGHRRLAVVDVSPQGHQPMTSRSGRFIVVFNGEIYNFEEIRSEIGDYSWHGHSDTEVMLAAFERWGIEAATRRFDGMFAFAVWDRQEQLLVLARDRVGEKPLYYGAIGDSFVFASELKAFRGVDGFVPKIDRNSLAAYVRLDYVPDPHCIYAGFKKLPPGTLAVVRGPQSIQLREYWSLNDTVAQASLRPFAGSDREALEHLDQLLRASVQERMVADVSVGAFLSGGVDSSLIVALMQEQSTARVRTFTIGFDDPEHDEAPFAKAVAQHLRTDHTEVYVTGDDALATIPLLPVLYDEPFSDPSQIPTFLVSKIARAHVTVALSGDAGDELFGGYERYRIAERVRRWLDWLPLTARRQLAGALKRPSTTLLNRAGHVLGNVLPSRFRNVSLGDKVGKLADIVDVADARALYVALMSHWQSPTEVVLGSVEPRTALADPDSWPQVDDFLHRMMYLDMATYLPGDILVKVDRAAMGVSLETRVPLLDRDVIEFAWRLAPALKTRDGVGKWILRQLLYRRVPQHLVDRPKRGFGVPLAQWLRGPLRDWAADLLHPERLRREGFFAVDSVTMKWEQHLAGIRNWHFQLWTVLMFQAWLQRTGAA